MLAFTQRPNFNVLPPNHFARWCVRRQGSLINCDVDSLRIVVASREEEHTIADRAGQVTLHAKSPRAAVLKRGSPDPLSFRLPIGLGHRIVDCEPLRCPILRREKPHLPFTCCAELRWTI